MSAFEWAIAIPYFGGGMLIWPVFRMFGRPRDDCARRLRKISLFTLSALIALGALLGVVALLGRFNHNWLPLTLLFPLINLVSVAWSIVAIFSNHNVAQHTVGRSNR